MTTFTEDCDRGPGCEWHALEQLADLLSERGDERIKPWDFMYMGVVDGGSGRHVYLFKHGDTRRYLNLDTNGHAYRYVSPPTGADHLPGTYELLELEAAIRHAVTF